MTPDIKPKRLAWFDFCAIQALILQGIANRALDMGLPLGHLEGGTDRSFLDVTIMSPTSGERLVQVTSHVTEHGVDVTLRLSVMRIPGRPDVEDLATWKIREVEATPGTIEIISYYPGEKTFVTLAALPPYVGINNGGRAVEGVAVDIACEALDVAPAA